MTSIVTWLVERATQEKIPAQLYDSLSSASLFEAEEQWCVSRVRLYKDLWQNHVEFEQWPESLHWDWARKAALEAPNRLEDNPDIRVFGLKAKSLWQGILLAKSSNDYVSHSTIRPQPVVYVDFIESAPWNWELQPLNRTGLFKGVGVQLIECAVRWSLLLGRKGRLGLHSLPQSCAFYVNRCHMHDFGPDPDYQELHYLELDQTGASLLLESKP
jgi:hypothetical protein